MNLKKQKKEHKLYLIKINTKMFVNVKTLQA